MATTEPSCGQPPFGAGLRGLPKEELPHLGRILWAQGHLLAPVAVIFLLLLVTTGLPRWLARTPRVKA